MTEHSLQPAPQRAIRVLVVDDEISARRRILQLLAGEPGLTVVGEASDGLHACAEIVRLAPDLVFLDMEMPERNGLQVIDQIGVDRMPATIFATAHDHYALPAFDAYAIDYLLKPFDRARFARSLARARAWIAAGAVAQCRTQMGAMLESLAQHKVYPDRILVRSGDNQQLLKAADILYISADRNYVRLHTLHGEHTMRERMIGILARLDPVQFRRIHRSHIVNLDHVKKLLPWFGGDSLVMMTDGCRLTLSRNYRDALKEFL